MTRVLAWLRLVTFASLGWIALAVEAHAIGAAPAVEFPLVRLVLGFALCAVLAAAAALALRHFGVGNARPPRRASGFWLRGGGRVRVAESHRMSVHADICRIIYADREYLVIVSAAGATLLRETDAPSEPLPEQAP